MERLLCVSVHFDKSKNYADNTSGEGCAIFIGTSLFFLCLSILFLISCLYIICVYVFGVRMIKMYFYLTFSCKNVIYSKKMCYFCNLKA